MIEGHVERGCKRDMEESVVRRQIRVRKFAAESGFLRKLESPARRTRVNGNLCDTCATFLAAYFFAASPRRFVAGATMISDACVGKADAIKTCAKGRKTLSDAI